MKQHIAIIILALSLVVQAELREPSDKSFKVFPKILMQEGSDFSDINNSYDTSRSEVRRQFIRDYRALYYSYSALEILQIFDQIYDLHKHIAVRNFPASFESSLIAELDRYSEFFHVPIKRLTFSMAPPPAIDFFLMGIFSHTGAGIFRVAVTFLKLPSGETQTFEANDYPDRVHFILAKKIFDYFYGNRYPPYENPQGTQLQFLLPAPMDQARLVAPNDAKNYCDAIGARLPFARELILARAQGPYHQGGMDLINNVYYVVADQTYWNEQYFYYNGKIEPINMMRTAAGMGALNGAYFCVRGDPSQTIQKENGWWKSIRVLRKTISSFEWNKNGELNKLECQLKKSGTPMFLLNANMCHADEE